MKVLIKIGGTLLDSSEMRARLAAEIAQAVRGGVQATVVHGGGKQMSRYLAERGIESRTIDGLRVTTPEVLDAVLKVFAGSVNHELVGAFAACGASAVGLTGMDGFVTEACQMSEELGAVGKPVTSDSRLLKLLMNNSYIPVVACVAGDRKGHFYNVNADQMAVFVASAIHAEKILFLTDVDGVRLQSNVVCSTLNLAQCRELIDAGIATGGMRTKLESASEAIRRGVGEVVIAPGALPGIVPMLLAGEQIGTRLVAEIGIAQ